MQIEPIYDAADFFLIRGSLLPFAKTCPSPGALLDFYLNHSLFQEAIAVASPSLHRSLKAFLVKKDEKGFEKLYPSLLKYFIRMSSRATPFGLFSFVGWGGFSDKTSLYFNQLDLKKRVRPDMGWVSEVIKCIHTELAHIRRFKIMTNPNLIKKNGRVLLSREGKGKNENISIKSSALSDFIFLHARNPIRYSDLENFLFSSFPSYPEGKITEYLFGIFQQGYLLSELSFCINTPFSFCHFNQTIRIELDAKFLPELESTQEILEEYQNCALGEGLTKLDLSLQALDAFKKVDYPMQVDSYCPGASFSLHANVKKKAEEMASILWNLTHENSTDSSFKSYQRKFAEKYGEYRLVPLLELIDPHRGLGIPEELSENTEESFSWDKLVLPFFGESEICLDRMINPYLQKNKEKTLKAPLSMELYFEVIADSETAIDDGKFTIVLNPTMASLQAGGTFGRFLYMWDASKVKQLREFIKKEEKLLPNVLMVEASFLPDNARTANVAYHEKLRDYQLQMHFGEHGSQTIMLEDIYVGYSGDRIYLYSKKLKKELRVTLSSAVNQDLGPKILKLMLQISESQLTAFSPFIWQGLSKNVYLPRVRYQNMILAPARWFFSYETLSLSETSSSESMQLSLRKSFESLNLPENIYLTHFDNRILLNWTEQTHFDLIVQALKNKKELCFFEAFENHRKKILRSDKGFHTSEFVVPLIKKAQFACETSPPIYPSTSQIPLIDRTHMMGGDWFFAKIHLSHEMEETCLTQEISHLSEELLKKNQITKWFYIRYQEESPHIRLRFHRQKDSSLEEILSTINRWAFKSCSEGKIKDISFHSYEKEIERYGGPEAIELAEAIFCVDSTNAIAVLNIKKQIDLPLFVIAGLGLLNILRSFLSTEAEILEFLKPMQAYKKNLSGLREHIKKAQQVAMYLFYEKNSIEQSDFLKELNILFKNADKPLQSYKKQILRNNIHTPWNSQKDLIQSFLHMHCNRLLGVNEKLEQKAISVALFLAEKLHHTLSHQEAFFDHSPSQREKSC